MWLITLVIISCRNLTHGSSQRVKPGGMEVTASQRIMLATEHSRTDAGGDIVHQSASVMPRMESQDAVGKAGVVGWQETGRGQVEVYYLYLIPFCTKRCMGHLGHQLLALRKGRRNRERRG